MQVVLTIVGVIATIVLGYFADRYFRVRPKLAVDLVSMGSSAKGKQAITAKLALVVTNQSSHTACDPEIIWPDGKPLLPVTLQGHRIIRGTESVNLHFSLSKEYTAEEVARLGINELYREVRNLTPELHPIKFINGRFVLTYRNEHGGRYYTEVILEKGDVRHRFRFLLPRN
jgi:hypothetical protein